MSNPSKRDKYNIVPKLMNVFGVGFDSIWRKFNPIWFGNHGFNPITIGIFRSFSLIGIIFGPLWSILADKTRKRKEILSIIFLTYLLIIKILDLSTYVNTNTIRVGVLFLFFNIFWTGIKPIQEGLILSYLKDNKKLFGRQQSFAAVGWLVSNLFTGYLYSWYGFYAVWNLMFVFVLITIFIMFNYIPKENKKYLTELNKTPFFTKLKKVIHSLNNKKVIKILIVLVIQGAGSNMIQSFLFVYLKQSLKAPEYLLGWSVVFNCLFELPIFFYAHELLDIFGINILFIIAQLAFIIRTFLYCLLREDNIIFILPIELLHGLTFSAIWMSATEFASAFCPKGLESVCMLILAFCYHYLGAFIGNFFGGIIFKHFGALNMFRIFGSISFIVCIGFILASYFEHQEKIQKNIQNFNTLDTELTSAYSKHKN